jgi:uncharacterized protein YqgC (DUF456 family)
MNIWLEILGVILLIIGIIFCVLPIIPGQVLAFGAILLKYFCETDSEISATLLITLLLALIVVTILDYVAPAWVVKKTGGSKNASRGALIGMIIGIIFTPVGMLVGMFIGAFIGEIITNRNIENALRTSTMSFLGFLLSTGLKLLYASVCVWLFIIL